MPTYYTSTIEAKYDFETILRSRKLEMRRNLLFTLVFVLSMVLNCFGQNSEAINKVEPTTGCDVEIKAEAGYKPRAYNRFIGSSSYYRGSVSTQSLSVEACGNKNFSYGGSISRQQANRYYTKTAEDKIDFGGFVSYKLPKGFQIRGEVSKESFGGWKYINASVEVSKKFQIKKNITVSIQNTTYRIFNSKKLTYSGNWVNDTRVPIVVNLKERVKLTFAPGISCDNNPYNSGITGHTVCMFRTSGRGDLMIGKGFGIYTSFDLATKLRWGGYTDRVGPNTARGYGISYTRTFHL
jgi:hypothetical protein